PGDVEREAGVTTALDSFGRVHDRGGSLRRVLDEFVPDADLGGVELACLAGVGVADGAVAALHRLDHAGRLTGSFAAGHRPVTARLVRPVLARRGLEVLLEVLRGTGLVGPVHRRDVQRGKLHARVVLGDLRVVPLGDLLVEDLRDGARPQVQLVDALDVVDDRDRRDVGRDLQDLAAAALLGRGQLVVVQIRVGAAEVGAARDELLTTATGTDRVVVDRHVRVGLGEPGDPRLLR